MGPFDYVLVADRELPKDQQTIWHLRTLTEWEYERIERGERVTLAAEGDAQVHMSGERHAKARKVLDFGLLGWTNYGDNPGREDAVRKTEGERSGLAAETLDLIEPYMTELSNAVLERKMLTREARKNS